MNDCPPVASVIVPSYRGAERLPGLLDAFAAQESGTPAFEVIVVVDGVDDGSVALVEAEERFDARAILLPENRGRVTALNTGFDAARGDVLIRCDDDLIVPPTFVSAHVEFHAGSPGPAGAVGFTRDVHTDTRYAQVYGRAASEASLAHVRSREADELWRHWAANCSVTRETWERIGPYDDRYRTYGWEDVDYGYRLSEAGVRLGPVPGACAEHRGPARDVRTRARKAFEAGGARALFRAIHPDAPVPEPSPGHGLWGLIVRSAARGMTSPRSAELIGRLADRALTITPAQVGRKIAAATIEGAGFAGARAQPSGGAPIRTADRPLRIAIAHDYLTQRGGAERVVLSLARAFPDAPIHTLFYEPEQTYPEFRERDIRVSALSRIPLLRRDPRKALPLLAIAASLQRIDADVVVVSTSGWAHAFPTRGARVVYCHSPARWLYLPDDYLGAAPWHSPARLALTALRRPLLAWDRAAAARAASSGRYVANSTVVSERIARAYSIDAPPVFPPFAPGIAEGPVETIPQLAGWAGAAGTEGGHALVVSRLQPYKNIDRVIEAFRGGDERLLVVGRGPLASRLRASAPPNVRLVEGLSDAQMRWAYENASVLIAASREDFGLTPLEAGAHGVPTAALRAGGYLDTIAEGVNGVFFDEPSPEAIRDAFARLRAHPLSREAIRAHVRGFSEERFIACMRELVDEIAGSRGGRELA